MDTRTTKAFGEAMGALEGQLETPVLPGEAVGWLERAHELALAAREEFTANMRANHEELLEAIGEEDVELLPRVQQLQETDQALRIRWEQFVRTAKNLEEVTSEGEPDETKFAEHFEELSNDGLKLIIESRGQEKAITAWFVESVNRERGDVD